MSCIDYSYFLYKRFRGATKAFAKSTVGVHSAAQTHLKKWSKRLKVLKVTTRYKIQQKVRGDLLFWLYV